MASPNEPWTLAGGKKNKPQNTSKGKKKAFVENMPRIEPSRKLLSDVLVIGVSCNEHYAALSCGNVKDIFGNRDRSWCALIIVRWAIPRYGRKFVLGHTRFPLSVCCTCGKQC